MYHEQTTLPERGDISATLPDAVVQYLAHTGVGMPIRELARLSDCHASTVSRRVARTEQRRDDPLFDAALRKMENWISGGGSDLQQRLASLEKRIAELAESAVSPGGGGGHEVPPHY